MPKAQLTYKLPEEKSDFNLASKSRDWCGTLWDLDNYLREKLKYGNDFKSADEALESVREYLHEMMAINGISFDDAK